MIGVRQVGVLSVAVGLLAGAAAGGEASGALTFHDRVVCQRDVERVYWRLRGASESSRVRAFDDAVPESVVRRKVERTLRLSAALEEYWGRPVEARHLQAEVERMARQTRRPGVLRELFDALDHDPLRIAECLARPLLVERLARQWYAFDDRFHAALREEIEKAIAARPGVGGMRHWGGAYREETWEPGEGRGVEPIEGSVERLPAGELDRRLRHLTERVGEAPGDHEGGPALSRPGAVHEDAAAFSVVALLENAPGSVRIASVTWPKESFDRWWEGARESVPVLPPQTTQYEFSLLGERSPAGCADDTWTPIPAGAPYARFRHEAVWTGAEMLVWGGLGQDLPSVGSRYDPATDTWSPMSDVGAPEPREGHTLVWTDSEMIVWGGRDGNPSFDTGGRYDPLTDTWAPTSTGAGVPEARADHTAVWTGTEMIVWGGGIGSSGSNYDSGARYDPVTDAWTPTGVAGAVPAARRGHTAVWTGTIMIVWGGDTNSGGRYDPATDSWLLTWVPSAPAARSGHSAVWTGDEMIIWGGVLVNPSGSPSIGGRYDPDTNSWAPMADPGGFRRLYSTVWTGSEMIVWGGRVSTAGALLDSGLRYNPAANAWSPVSTGPRVPDARYEHSAVWAGTEMIVWGGRGAGVLGTGGRYDPLTDSWLPTGAGVGQPSGRRFHTAVWTGAEMIVWGGSFDFGALGTGSAYDPATASWTPTSDVDAPTLRSQHSAVWTGAEMIIWGGGNRTDTGGRYDPATRTWQATSVDPMTPAARDGHTAVWTGEEMIVWGGVGAGNNRLDTGGRYDPATDSWSPTSTGAGVPQARVDHTAVWAGTEMVVWGGSEFGWLDTGARYDPLLDTWTPTDTAGPDVPSARQWHAAVWTGTEMIVWGGTGDAVVGGRYAPSTDSWTATAVDIATPAARWYPTAVWTGDEMIVWGGWPGTTEPVDTGGRYDPQSDSWTATLLSAETPSPRFHHTAVWTEEQMLVWGGFPYDVGAAGYCASCTPKTWYLDADRDGLGTLDVTLTACTTEAGYSLFGGDCDDADPTILLGATEVCNGKDDDCNGLVDDGPSGLDTDGDRVTNACDNCVDTPNVAQEDTDDDQTGDACDPDDGIIYLLFPDEQALEWPAEVGNDTWNAYRGDLDLLRATGVYTQVIKWWGNELAAQVCGLVAPAVADAAALDPGEVAFFLVTGVSGSVEGDLGPDSDGVVRPNANPCP